MQCPRKIGDTGGSPVFKIAQSEDTWRENNTCSYCGSLHPDEFMRRLETGEQVIPTDKGYKAYVGPGLQKFYYPHLSEEQKKRFIELYNTKKMNVGVPGHLYVLPYFFSRKSTQEAAQGE